jgi:AAA+ ATPase superfamily predicted ATPase
MKPINFIDRKIENDYLESIYRKSGKQLVVIYGRRRVGKTELINHFCKNKETIYFLADRRGTKNNAERLAAICAEHFNDVKPEVKNFDDVFTYIKNRAGKKKIIIVIDEFSYLVEKDEATPSIFQLIFDEILKETNILIILSGSSISMMYKGVLSYESPLYGRRSGEWMLKSMPFKEIRKFYPHLKFEEAIKTYAVIGGIPAYATHFKEGKIFNSIKKNILSKGEYLYSEPEVFLKEELRDPSTYFSILEAMTSSAKLTDIANTAGIHAKDAPQYLKILENLEIVKKINPVTEKKSKKTSYLIKDNFFNFWFKFVYPRKSQLEQGHQEEVLKIIKRDLNAYTGLVFEQVCEEYLETKKPIPFTKIGKWWGHSKTGVEEIDVISIDEKDKKILFAECKWQNNVDAEQILKKLMEKAKTVKWHDNQRKEYYAIFAKTFKRKNKLKNTLLFDLEDLKKEL